MKTKLLNNVNNIGGGPPSMAGNPPTTLKELPNIQTRALVGGGPLNQLSKEGNTTNNQNAQNNNIMGTGLSAYLQNAKTPKSFQNGQGNQPRHSSLRNHLKGIYLRFKLLIDIYMSNGLQQNNLQQHATSAQREASQDASNKKANANFSSVNGNGIKLVKPQELSLDLIVPSNMKKQAPVAGSQLTSINNNNQSPQGANNSVTSILQSMRTPQNNQNQILQPLQHKKILDMTNGNSPADSTLYHLSNQYNQIQQQQQNQLGTKRPLKQRVLIGQMSPIITKPDIISLNSPANINSYNNNRISTSKERSQQVDITPYKNKSVPLNLSISQSKTPKDHIYNHKKQQHKLQSSEDRLNLSVEVMNNKHGSNNNRSIDNNLRLSRITEEKLNISVDGISTSRAGSSGLNQTDSNIQDEDKLLIRGNQQKKELLTQELQQSNQAQDLGKMPVKVQLNLENLIKIEDKISNLMENLRQSKFQQVSQLCSDWWELTDEEEYSLAKFEKAYKEEKSKKELKAMMVLEILAVAVANYFTNAPELIKPTHLQLSQVRNLLNYVHQNFLNAIDLILSRLPQEILDNQFASQLQNILKNKKGKRSKKSDNVLVGLRSNNENLQNLLKNLVRQGAQGSSANGNASLNLPFTAQMASNKKLNKNMKLAMLNGPPLKPLYSAINKSLKNLENQSVTQTRNIIIKASEEIEMLKQYANLPALYGIGGTAVGGYEPLPLVEAPYLPPLKEGVASSKTYTLVLDLDETLVHYFEVGSEGNFLVRPGCDKFLKEMSEIYEVVIFTAAMQDYADWVLDTIDKEKHISYRLYRQHALPYGPVFVKDLSRIGRDLSKTIIVDNVAENFQLQPDNGIFIKSWFDDMTDTALSELAPLLKEIVKKQVNDVRDALRKFRDQMLDQISKGIQNPQLSLD